MTQNNNKADTGHLILPQETSLDLSTIPAVPIASSRDFTGWESSGWLWSPVVFLQELRLRLIIQTITGRSWTRCVFVGRHVVVIPLRIRNKRIKESASNILAVKTPGCLFKTLGTQHYCNTRKELIASCIERGFKATSETTEFRSALFRVWRTTEPSVLHTKSCGWHLDRH